MLFRAFFAAAFLILTLLAPAMADDSTQVVISVPEQRLFVMHEGRKVATYRVSTSKFGVGDEFHSFRTPTGIFRIANKIGAELSPGAVLKGLRPTGEVLKPNAPGRDPIVTRVLCLAGLEPANRNALTRGIYIHGTPEEKLIGRPASYGCVRMRSKDVIQLFNFVPVGTIVRIEATRDDERLMASNARSGRSVQ